MISSILCAVDRVLPPGGWLKRRFRAVVFVRPWRRSWSRSAYEASFRDRLFNYIMTFFYEYPIKKGDVVIQVGASFGEETARFARAVGPAGTVVAIEPEQQNVKRLTETFADTSHVRIIPKAASDRTGKMNLLVAGEREHRLDFTDAQLTYTWWGQTDDLDEKRYARTAIVQTDTLDNLLLPLNLGRIDFLLIETNGSELEVIKGLEKLLSQVRRIGARGHVKRDGAPIWRDIASHLEARGFVTRVTDEEMILASH